MAVILMTGASGRIGGMLRKRLGDHELRLTDLTPGDGVERLDVTTGRRPCPAGSGARLTYRQKVLRNLALTGHRSSYPRRW